MRGRAPETVDCLPSENRLVRTEPGALVVLTKAPVAGHAKTRLAAAIGPDAAAALAHAFVADTVSVAESGPWTAIVSHSSPATCSCMGELVSTAGLVPQSEGDLGNRIHAAFGQALDTAERAVLIGSDTPDLPPCVVQEAFDALAGVDIVLGPASDGGFYLIGVTAAHSALFDSVAWSTPTVLETVHTNARRLGLRVRFLDEWGDVDDYESLRALGDRLATHDRAPLTRAAVSNLTGVFDHV